MGGGFNKREPIDTSRFHLHPPVADIFRRHHWLGFLELLSGYDDDIAHEFAMALNPHSRTSATTMVRGLFITINPKVIKKVTTHPQGVQWRREDKASNTFAKKNFFLNDEEPIEDKNGVRRKSLPYPWDEVSYHILKYISCEGRLSVVYGYQFRLLHELTFGDDLPTNQRLNVPYFLLQSIIDMSQKVQEGKHHKLAHHGLIKLIMEDAFVEVSKFT